MTHYNGEKYILVKPTTYMNLSGEALRKFYDYFEIDIEDIQLYMMIRYKNCQLQIKSKRKQWRP